MTKEKYTGPRVTSTTTFIKKAVWRHGDKYDYSKVEYKNKETKVCIICPEHGEFWQSPNNHYAGNNCPKCSESKRAMSNRHDQAWFLDKCKASHGSKYDYSMAKYKKLHERVSIICPHHGVFEQTPWQHITAEHGCHKCAKESMARKQSKDTEWFIKKATSRHGDLFDYSQTEYRSSGEKLEIICRVHGSFWQLPAGHINGTGCPKCLGYGLDTDEWVERFREVHGSKYDYSLFVYNGKLEKSVFVCESHGEFLQLPGSHLAGHGCQKCYGRDLGTQGWIERFKDVHGDLYDYSVFEYHSHKEKSRIICPKHGEFLQSPVCHNKGQGCPDCAVEKISVRWNANSAYGIMGFYGSQETSNIYVAELGDSFIKVGLAKEIQSRMNTINKESGYSVEYIYSACGPANELFELEQKILRKSNLKRYYPAESFAGSTECLELSELPKVLQMIEDWEKSKEESFSETS